MQDALKRCGWHNYSLFMHTDGTLIGVFDSDRTLDECLAAMEKEEVNARWQAGMARFFPSAGDRRPDEIMVQLEEIMYINPTQ